MLIKILEALKEVKLAITELDTAIQQRKVVLALHRRSQTLQLLSTLPGNYTPENEPKIYTKVNQEFDRLTQGLIQLLESSFWGGIAIDLDARSLRLHVPVTPITASEGSLLDEITVPMSVAMSLALQHQLGVAQPKIDALAAKLIPFVDLFIVEPTKSTFIPKLKVERKGNHAVLSLAAGEPSKSTLAPVVQGLANAAEFFQFITDHLINPTISETSRLEASFGHTAHAETSKIESLCSQLGTLLLPYVVDRLVRCCFETSIPQNRAELEDYQRSVSVEVDRFVPVLSKFSWLHSEQESPSISITDSSSDLTLSAPESSDGWASIRKFIDFLKNSQLHFAIKKRHASLARARELLLSGVYTSRMVGDIEFESSSSSSAQPDSLLTTPLFLFPQCLVRDVIVEVVALAQNLVSDAFNEPSSHNSSSSTLPSPHSKYNRVQIQRILLDTAKDIFDLYRAIVPTLERHRIANIPSLSMLFHNDCQYIAHHITLLGAVCRLHLRFGGEKEIDPAPQTSTPPLPSSNMLNPSKNAQNLLRSASESVMPESGSLPAFSLAELVPAFRSLAEHFYLEIVTAVRDHNLLLLERMNGLVQTDEEERKQRCLLSAKHIVSELESRDLMWGETLPAELHRVTMGRLLNEVVEWMLEAVFKFKDFCEAETESLSQIFTTLFPLARIFVNASEGTSDATDEKNGLGNSKAQSVALTRHSCAKYVRSWLKFEDMTDAYSSRMVELVERYNTGDFHFSREATISIIKSLFLDSQKRSECISALRTDLSWVK